MDPIELFRGTRPESINKVDEAAEKIEQIDTAFKARAKEEQKRFEVVTDSEYWFCVCFETSKQKDEFLAKVGIADVGDKYLDGLMVAEKMGVELKSERVKFGKTQKSKRLLGLVFG